MKDRRALVVLAVFVVLIIAGGIWKFSSQSKSSATAGGFTPNTVAPASTTSSTVAAVGANDVDWNGAIKQIVATENSLFSKPDASKVNTYILPSCDCYTDTASRLQKLQDNNWHVKGNTEVLKSAFFSTGTDNSVALIVNIGSAGNPTVDASGKVIEQASTGPSLPMTYNLVKGSDGIWRIASRAQIEGAVPR